ncbi:MAG: hypothetical protein ACOX6W_00005, partial [Lentisphaeria bacterium]
VITYAQKEKLKPLSPKNYFWSAFLCSDELASHSPPDSPSQTLEYLSARTYVAPSVVRFLSVKNPCFL